MLCHTLLHTYMYVCSLHTWTYLDTYVCTWERRRIEMKAKVAFDPQPKVEQKSIISKESQIPQINATKRKREICVSLGICMYQHVCLYVCVCVNANCSTQMHLHRTSSNLVATRKRPQTVNAPLRQHWRGKHHYNAQMKILKHLQMYLCMYVCMRLYCVNT